MECESSFIKKELLKKQHVYRNKTLRPQLVKSLVIVIYFFESEMRDAVIFNY